MTVDEAISRLTTRPDIDKQVLESPFFKFWHRFDTQTCDAIAALLQQQQQQIEQAEKVCMAVERFTNWETTDDYGLLKVEMEKALAEWRGE